MVSYSLDDENVAVDLYYPGEGRQMEVDEARRLLLDAGIPADLINDEAIRLASAVMDVIHQRVAKQIAERFIRYVQPLMEEAEKNRAKFRELGVNID